MTGILALAQDRADLGGPFLEAAPSSAADRFKAAWNEALAPDRWFNMDASRRDKWQAVADGLHGATGDTFLNPYGPPTHDELFDKDGIPVPLPTIQANRTKKINDAYLALQGNTEFAANIPNPATIDQQIANEGAAVRDKAQSLVGTGNGLAGFFGGQLAPTPENIAGLIIPPSRTVLGATAVGRSFLGTLVREGAYQAGANAALTGASDIADSKPASEIGSDMVESAAGGAILGAGFHTLFHGPATLWAHWNGLPQPVRDGAPTQVKDAFNVLERDTLYSGQNRLGIDPLLHERYQNNALDAIMRQTPLRLADLTPPDTATAIGAALREPGAPAISGLPRAAGLDLLPEKEIMPHVAAEAPQDWARLHEARGELADVNRQIETIEADPAYVVAPGKPDAATQAVLDDLEARLDKAKPAQRAQLEQQIEGIHESLTPATQHAALSAQREELASEVDGLMRKFKARADDMAEGLVDVSDRIGRRAPEQSPQISYTTAKGSTYQVHDDGTTTRQKARRPEHPGDEGPQPRSQATAYVTPGDARKLGEFQTEGSRKALVRLKDGRIGVGYLDGPSAGKVEGRTVVTPEGKPRVGLIPVEIWKNGERVHFGNEITDVRTTSGSVARPEGNPDIATPADLDKAIQGAEFERQIRSVRGVGAPVSPGDAVRMHQMRPPVDEAARDGQARALIAGIPTGRNVHTFDMAALAPKGAPFKDVQAAARKLYRGYIGTEVVNEPTGMRIAFDKGGLEKMGSLGEDFLRLVPHLPEMLAKFAPAGPPRADRAGRGLSWHTFRGVVDIDGKPHGIALGVRQNADGSYHYSIQGGPEKGVAGEGGSGPEDRGKTTGSALSNGPSGDTPNIEIRKATRNPEMEALATEHDAAEQAVKDAEALQNCATKGET